MEPDGQDSSNCEKKPVRDWLRYLVGLALVLLLWALSEALDNARLQQLALTIAGATAVITLARLFARIRKR